MFISNKFLSGYYMKCTVWGTGKIALNKTKILAFKKLMLKGKSYTVK